MANCPAHTRTPSPPSPPVGPDGTLCTVGHPGGRAGGLEMTDAAGGAESVVASGQGFQQLERRSRQRNGGNDGARQALTPP